MTPKPNPHWAQRCLARGIDDVCPRELEIEIWTAITTKNETYVQFVMATPGNRSIFRFALGEDRIFYALCESDGRPVTLLTQAMLRVYKATRRSKTATCADVLSAQEVDDVVKHARHRQKRLKLRAKRKRCNWWN